MKPLCDEIANNHPTKGTAPSFAYAPDQANSTSTCIYVNPLNVGKCYCADSVGYAGVTTSAACPGTCTTAGGAKCPTGLE